MADMNKGRVFVVQESLRRDPVTDTFVPAFDLTPAAVYGPMQFCLPPGQVALAPQPMIQSLRRTLKDYGDDDYILPVGDPLAVMAAARIAADANRGRIRVLRWDKRTRSYIVVPLQF